MVSIEEVHTIALGLPEVTEADHHGMASFRLRGKVLATLPDDAHLRVMVDEGEIRAAVAEYPSVCQEYWRGRRLACVVVSLGDAPAGLVGELLTSAWLRRAPGALADRLPR